MDRRVRKTKSQLRAGLAQLMREKSIREITVKELVDKVDINRSTFYLHYSDIPGMLKEIEGEILEEMGRAIQEHPIEEGEKSIYFFMQDMFRVLAANREIGCALVGPHGDIAFVSRIENFLEQYSRHVRGDMLPEQLAEMKYFYSFCWNGCLGFVKTWLEEGEDKSPEDAAKLMFQMVTSSMRAFFDNVGGKTLTENI